MKLPDAVRRAARTFVQAFVGVLAAQVLAVAAGFQQGTWVPDVDWLKRVLISACGAGVIALFAYIQNYLEDNTGFPAIGKAQASSGEKPVTVDPVK